MQPRLENTYCAVTAMILHGVKLRNITDFIATGVLIDHYK